MNLYERVHGVRLCVDCHVHAAVEDGDRCAECLNAYLRATRAQPVAEAAWLTRSRQQPHGLARAIDRSAA